MKIFFRFYILSLLIFGTLLCPLSALAQDLGPVASSLHWQKFSLEGKIEDKISKLLLVSVPDHQIIVKVLIQAKAKEKNNRRQKFLDSLAKNPAQQSKLDDELLLRKLDINKFDFVEEEDGKVAPSLPDLLEGIKDIDVILFFPKDASKELRKDIVKLVSQLFDKKFNRTLNIIVADNPYANHAKLEKDLKPPTFEQKWRNFLVPFALVIAGLLFSAILFLMVSRLKQFSKDLSGALRDAGQNISHGLNPEDKDAELINPSDAGTIGEELLAATEASSLQQISFEKYSGIKRYKKILENDFDNALILINRWLKSDRQIEMLMVHLIFKALDDQEVFKLTDKLSIFQLQKVQVDMKLPLKEKDVGLLDKHIELSVMDLMLDTKPKLSFVMRNFISNLTASEAVQLQKEFKLISGLLFHYLPENIIREMIELMPDKDVSAGLQMANEFNREFMMKNGAVIEKFIAEKCEKENSKKASGFMQILPVLLESVSGARETSLLKEVQQYCSNEEFDRILIEMLPTSFLITYSDQFPKKVFGSYSIRQKAKIIASKPEQITWEIEEWVGAKGSKSREILEIEISDIKNDAKLLSEVQKNGDKIWKDFFKKTRNVLKSNNDIQKQLKTALDEWSQANFKAIKDESKIKAA